MSGQVDVLDTMHDCAMRLRSKKCDLFAADLDEARAAVAALIAERDALVQEVAALRQQPAPVDLEQFREAVAMVSRGTKRAHVIWIGDAEKRIADRAYLYIEPQQPAPVVDDAMVERVWELYWRAEKSGDVVVTEKEMHAIASLIARAHGVQS